MSEATLSALRGALPWWVGAGALAWVPFAALVAWLGVRASIALALAPMRGLPGDAHWTERARRAMPARTMSVAAPLLAALLLAFGGARSVGPLSWVTGGVVGALTIAAVYAVTGSARRVEARIGLPSRSLGERVSGVVVVWLVLLPHLFVFLALAVLMPADPSAAIVTTVVAVVAVLALVRSGASLRIARALGLARPANDRLAAIVRDAAERVGVRPSRVWLLRWPVVNALAFVQSGELAFTERALETLSDGELAAITAHELGHLAEPRGARAARLVGLLALLPIGWARPVLVALGPDELRSWALFLVLVLVGLVIGRGVQRLARRMEERADAIAHHHEASEGEYARALERIYELNLMPAVQRRKSAVHPHLYDRLIAAGVVPSYPRPAPPPAASRLAIAALAAAIVAGTLAWHIGLDAYAARHDAPPMWLVALRGGELGDLGRLGHARWVGGDLEGALPFYRAIAELAPDDAYWIASGSILAASAGHCDEAETRATRARELLRDDEDATRALLVDCATAIEWCRQQPVP